MNDILSTLKDWEASGRGVALATVVRTVGSSPRGVGAKLAVTALGEMVGSVSGGCVEGAVVEEALEVLQTGEPRLLHFGVADEEAWGVGLSCGGTIEVFVEVLDRREVFRGFVERVERHLPVALATVVAGPSRVGDRLRLDGSGKVEGTLGEAEADAQAKEIAAAALSRGISSLVDVGEHRIFVEVRRPPPRLVVVGAVHIALTLSRLAREMGFRVIVSDARGRFATPERFPDVDELILGWPDEVLSRVALDEFSYVVVITHDSKLDNPALQAALASPAPYVGALGSRKTHARRVAALRDAGVREEEIARIHAPIGLDIGARTPSEIALATMAEIVAVRNQQAARSS